jgi:hypothetical protein
MRLDDGDAWLLIKIVFWGIPFSARRQVGPDIDPNDTDTAVRLTIVLRF